MDEDSVDWIGSELTASVERTGQVHTVAFEVPVVAYVDSRVGALLKVNVPGCNAWVEPIRETIGVRLNRSDIAVGDNLLCREWGGSCSRYESSEDSEKGLHDEG